MTDENSKQVEIEQEIAERSSRMVDGLNALAGAGVSVGEAVPHADGTSDFSKWLDLMVVKAQRGKVEFTAHARPEMSNPTGLLHGGVQAAIMDSAIGVTCATLGYRGFPITINLNVSFLGKLPIGSEARVIGEVKREGARIVHAHSTILDSEGNVISEGEANLLRTSFVPSYVKATE